MTMTAPYTYSVLRYVHDTTIGEFVNVERGHLFARGPLRQRALPLDLRAPVKNVPGSGWRRVQEPDAPVGPQ